MNESSQECVEEIRSVAKGRVANLCKDDLLCFRGGRSRSIEVSYVRGTLFDGTTLIEGRHTEDIGE